MAKLTTKERKGLKPSQFAGPGKTFPVEDKKHARLALSGASRSKNVGNISAATEAKIDAKANKALGKSSKPEGPKKTPVKTDRGNFTIK